MQNLSKRISEVSCLYRSTIRRKGLLVPQNPHLFQLYALKVSCLLMGVAFNIHTGMYLSFQVENAKILSASKYDADSRTVWSWYVATTADWLADMFIDWLADWLIDWMADKQVEDKLNSDPSLSMIGNFLELTDWFFNPYRMRVMYGWVGNVKKKPGRKQRRNLVWIRAIFNSHKVG